MAKKDCFSLSEEGILNLHGTCKLRDKKIYGKKKGLRRNCNTWKYSAEAVTKFTSNWI